MQKILLLIALAAVSLAAACSEAKKPVANAGTPAAATPAPMPTQAVPFPDVERISLADAKKDFDAGKALFIDTRPAAAYAEEHVKGAINITADDFAAKADTLAKGKKIIAYCS